VNLSSVQYSYSTNGLLNYSVWTDEQLLTIANQTNAEESSRWFVELDFRRGGENYVQWRAKDRAGNGYSLSDDLFIKVNSLPTVIVEKIDRSVKLDSQTEITLNAENTYDIDDDINALKFLWTSNISGNLGTEKTFETRLIPGKHHITLEVSDGYNSAYHNFNLTIEPGEPLKSSSSSSTSDITSNLGFSFFLLLIILIVITIIFSVLLSREKHRRKELEERVSMPKTPRDYKYQTMVPKAGGVSNLDGVGGVGVGSGASQPFPESFRYDSIGVQDKEKIEQLPRVGATVRPGTQVPQSSITTSTSAGAGVGFTPSTEDSVETGAQTEPMAQLPPAQKPATHQPTIETTTPSPDQPQGPVFGEPYPNDLDTKYEPKEPEEPDLDLPIGFTPDDPEYKKKVQDGNEE
jgi:hypothetical protein